MHVCINYSWLHKLEELSACRRNGYWLSTLEMEVKCVEVTLELFPLLPSEDLCSSHPAFHSLFFSLWQKAWSAVVWMMLCGWCCVIEMYNCFKCLKTQPERRWVTADWWHVVVWRNLMFCDWLGSFGHGPNTNARPTKVNWCSSYWCYVMICTLDIFFCV